MLYFRFDNKNGFKGKNHKSGFAGWYEICLDKLEGSRECSELEEKYGFGTDEYFQALDNLVEEYAEENGYILNGCSCFTLTKAGIEEFLRYIETHPIDDYEEINIFEGIDQGYGHDGENVAQCTKIVFTGKTADFMNIVNDDDLTTTDKLDNIIKSIKK